MPSPPNSHDDVLKIALQLLKQRAYLIQELRNRLESKGCPKDSVDSVLQFLVSRRFLDDEKTIEQTITRASGKRAIGRKKLQSDLVARGLPEEEAQRVADGKSDEDELFAMAGLLEKKGRERAERGRYGRYLLGRGFDLDQVEVALDRFFAV